MRHVTTQRQRRGAVLVIVLLSITLLVGIVFFVYNLGDQVNRKQAVQNVADAAAVGGAGWMARSMNVVSMDNVGTSKCLSLVITLDSMPLATKMAWSEADRWEESLGNQLLRDMSGLGAPQTNIRTGLESLRERIAMERDVLHGGHVVLNGNNDLRDQPLNEGEFDIRTVTNWPDGELWKAMYSMDEMSQATAASAGYLAQDISVRLGDANGGGVSFLAPQVPQMAHVRGEFRDFQPTLEGTLRVRSSAADQYRRTGGNGGVIPDWTYPHRLGPWARLHQWRDLAYSGGYWVSNPGPKVRGGGGGPGGRSIGGSAVTRRPGGHHVGREVIGYRPFGPYSWALRRISWWANGHEWRDDDGIVPDTFFSTYVRDLSWAKLRYMFNPSRPPQTRTIHYPDYVTDYPTIRARKAGGDDPDVNRTMYYVVEIASSVAPADPGWMSNGTYRDNSERPLATWIDGWSDPEPAPGFWGGWTDEYGDPFQKVADYIWRGEYNFEVTHDPDLGLELQLDEDGNPIWHTVYLTRFYIWCGADIGEDIDIDNPCGYDSFDDLPSPILMDTTVGDYDPYTHDHDEGVRRTHFSYLGVARRSRQAPIWPERFTSANPAAVPVAVAQAEVCNKSSWDFWTRDWMAQLVPVTQWSLPGQVNAQNGLPEGWVERMDAGMDDLGNSEMTVEGLSGADVQEVVDYLTSISNELVDVFMNH